LSQVADGELAPPGRAIGAVPRF